MDDGGVVTLLSPTGEFVTTINFEDLEKVKKHYWSLRKDGYVRGFIDKDTHVSLHRFISEVSNKKLDGTEIDHIDRNKSNNQRSNLRIANRSINSLNRGLSKRSFSGLKGVNYEKDRDKWRTVFQGRLLGRFNTKIGAYARRLYEEEKYWRVNPL